MVFIVIAHDQPLMLARLISRLDSPDAGIVVHLDRRTDPRPFRAALEGFGRVHLVENPVKARWAAFSLVDATMRAMRTAFRIWGSTPSHHVVLSGADYPLKSADRIVDFLQRNPGRQFIRRFDPFDAGDERQIRRIRGRHFRELADRNTLARKPLFAVETILRVFPRRLPRGVRFTIGSQWIALSTACVAWCLRYVDEHPEFMRLFKGMFAPDEIFFHTLVENSPFAAEAGPVEPYYQVTELGGPWRYGNLHYLHPIVAITDPADVREALADPDLLFARKFHPVHSSAVLDAIDARLARASSSG
ncbi:beta-1,6-N-acetylglucosaminyltransferase [Amnibacterium kyonggiense]